jgi:hypothetical protein
VRESFGEISSGLFFGTWLAVTSTNSLHRPKHQSHAWTQSARCMPWNARRVCGVCLVTRSRALTHHQFGSSGFRQFPLLSKAFAAAVGSVTGEGKVQLCGR